MPTNPWPSCPTCGHGYSVTIGLPVVIGPPKDLGGRRVVEADIDFGEAAVMDDSASISCGCSSPLARISDEAWDQLVTVLADLGPAAARSGALCYVDLEAS